MTDSRNTANPCPDCHELRVPGHIHTCSPQSPAPASLAARREAEEDAEADLHGAIYDWERDERRTQPNGRDLALLPVQKAMRAYRDAVAARVREELLPGEPVELALRLCEVEQTVSAEDVKKIVEFALSLDRAQRKRAALPPEGDHA